MPRPSNHYVGFLFAILAFGVVWLLFSTNSLALFALAGLLGYIGGVVADAWVKVTHYWLIRGTEGKKRWDCGGCGRAIYRKSMDWIPRCHSCGWKAGRPGIRWLTHSVPIEQALRRNLVLGGIRTGLAAIVVVGSLMIPVAAVTQAPIQEEGSPFEPVTGPVDDAIAIASDSIGDAANATQDLVNDVEQGLEDGSDSEPADAREANTQTATSESSQTPASREISVTATEEIFVKLLNEKRSSGSLSQIRSRRILREMGIDHSEVMAEAGRIGHSGLGDGSIESRFSNRGLLPQCRIQTSGNRFYPGAENAGQTWIERNIISGDTGPDYIDSNRDLAKSLFTMWMNSAGHRRPMMEERLGSVGLGFVITDTGEVFAALEMCGR